MSDGAAAEGPPSRDGDARERSGRRDGSGARRGRGGRNARGGRRGRGARQGAGRAEGTPGDERPKAQSTGNGASAARPARGNTQRARREVSAGGIVYRVDGDASGHGQPLYLLIRDSYRNWGFPKGHLERGEQPDAAAVREVVEETGLAGVALRGVIETIDWYFRFRGRLIHKICHFNLMETERAETSPQVAEGITACRWAPFEEAVRLVSYANAREVLKRAHAMVRADGDVAGATSSAPRPAGE